MTEIYNYTMGGVVKPSQIDCDRALATGQHLTPISSLIYHVVGITPTAIAIPATAKTIMLCSDKGGWRMHPGDLHLTGMPAVEFPAASDAAGNGAIYLRPVMVISYLVEGLSFITVRGYAADSVLTYYFT